MLGLEVPSLHSVPPLEPSADPLDPLPAEPVSILEAAVAVPCSTPVAATASRTVPMAIGRTAQSLVVICETGVGRLYYKGMRPEAGTSVEIDDPVRTGTGFRASNAGVQYILGPGALVITSGGTQLADEAMLSYWSG